MANSVISVVQSGEQIIATTVTSNERGATGAQGPQGEAATVTVGNTYTRPADREAEVMNTGTSSAAVLDFYIPRGVKGEPGKDGAIQYHAGIGINITDDNTIEATGLTHVEWGGLTGNIANQTDLTNAIDTAKTGAINTAEGYTDTKLAGYAKTTDLATVATTGEYSDLNNAPAVNNATLTIKSNNESLGTFTANASSDVAIDVAAPVITMTNTDPGEGAALAANHFIFYYED